jgi:transcription termination factor Rho
MDQRDQRDQRDQQRHPREQTGRRPGAPWQGEQDRRGGPSRGGRGREQGGLPPVYTPAPSEMDRYGYPQGQRPAPRQPAPPLRLVETRGMVFQTGHGAAMADVLDERTLQPVARITLEDMRRMGLRPGDIIAGQADERGGRRTVVSVETVNGGTLEEARERPSFDQLTATFPDRRIRLEQGARPISARMIDLFAPLGFGSRALIVAPPKTGKTTLIREAAEAVLLGYPNAVVMAVLVGERPEEVTDLRSRLEPRGGHVYAASFDESTERHAWLVQVAVERAKRVAESGRDAFMVLDSLTRLARAENLSARGGGRTLSGGIDAQALDTGRRAFGAARNLEEGGSITILATCLVDTGSRQDDVVYEEFKGTGNMELHLSRELAQRRLFPAVDAIKSGTRREEMLLSPEELRGATTLRRLLADKPVQAATQWLLDAMERTPSNASLLNAIEQQTGARAR